MWTYIPYIVGAFLAIRSFRQKKRVDKTNNLPVEQGGLAQAAPPIAQTGPIFPMLSLSFAGLGSYVPSAKKEEAPRNGGLLSVAKDAANSAKTSATSAVSSAKKKLEDLF